MGHFGDQVVAIATAIVGVAIVAVLVSQRSNTANVITAAAQGFSEALGTAVSPVTGATSQFGPISGFTGTGQNFNLNTPNFGF